MIPTLNSASHLPLQDPMPYFSKYLDGPVHGIFATDALETKNFDPSDQGLEKMTNMHININTGERL